MWDRPAVCLASEVCSAPVGQRGSGDFRNTRSTLFLQNVSRQDPPGFCVGRDDRRKGSQGNLGVLDGVSLAILGSSSQTLEFMEICPG